ncbi:MAG: M23 family metallopeptidase [Pseudomonadota bacterium]|nr:M23 family metallopeptidase [Pseudomonadota bacterium]
MPTFDPRLAPSRISPLVAGGVAILAAAGCGIGISLLLAPHEAGKTVAKFLTPQQAKALEHQAFAGAEARAGLAAPVSMPVKVQSGETLESAVQRTGVTADEAHSVVQTLAQAFDTIHIKAGLAFQAVVAAPRDHRGPTRLIGLSMKTGPASAVTLSRTFDGALKLRELEEKVRDETTVAAGNMQGSLYESALKAGADSRMVAQAVQLFSHKIDFAREIHPQDQFKLVFDRKVTESGRTVETGDLLYAEIGAKGQTTKFYRFDNAGHTDYFDELGKNIKGFLLRTPLDGARVTSSFGMRLHPLLGYTRMHAGIDFGAPTGTPVFAAGAGVVKEERWAGGYGHWLKIEHQGGWATGYGHLSRYASGLHVGEHVAQGQVVAYVGSTGMSTGPHLHYEVMKGAEKLNPTSAKVPQGTILGGRELLAFKSQKARVDQLLNKAGAGKAEEPAHTDLASLNLRGREGVSGHSGGKGR